MFNSALFNVLWTLKGNLTSILERGSFLRDYLKRPLNNICMYENPARVLMDQKRIATMWVFKSSLKLIYIRISTVREAGERIWVRKCKRMQKGYIIKEKKRRKNVNQKLIASYKSPIWKIHWNELLGILMIHKYAFVWVCSQNPNEIKWIIYIN